MSSPSAAILAVTSLLASPALAAGPLVIVGGALDPGNEPIYRAVLDGVLEGHRLCIVPTASADPEKSSAAYVREFERYGGEGAAVSVPLTPRTRERAREAAFAHDLLACGGFFFTGGDQSRIVDVFRPQGAESAAAKALRAVHRAGGVIAGSSAGAAMMSDPMIGAGRPETALRAGVVREEDARGIWVRDGMGFLETGITGQHFLARGRLPRLMVALRAHPEERFGLGVDENSAALVEGDRLRVIGASQVALLEILDPRRFRLTLLGDGDRAELSGGRATAATDKTPLAAGPTPRAPRRPFRDDALPRFLIALARSDARSADLRAPPYTLRVSREEGFAARARRDAEGREIEASAFAGPFLLELLGGGETP